VRKIMVLILIRFQDEMNHARLGYRIGYGAVIMARPRRVDTELVEEARTVVARAANVDELRCAQAVLLPFLLGV